MSRLHWSGGLVGYLAFSFVFAAAATLLAAAPAFVESVGDELAAELPPPDTSAVTLQAFASFSPEFDAAAVLESALDEVPGLSGAATTFALGGADTAARSSADLYGGVTIFAREGAVEALEVVADGGPADGVFVSQNLASELGVEPGSAIVVASRVWSLDVGVRGVYADIAPGPSPYWLGIPGELLPQARRVFGGVVQPELLVASPEAIGTISSGAAVRPDTDVDDQVPVALAQGRLWVQAELAAVDSFGMLQGMANRVTDLERDAQDPATTLGAQLAEGGIQDLTLRTPLFDMVDRVEDAIDRVQPTVGVVAITAGVVGLVVVGLGAYFVARRRERDLRIWQVEGRSPLAVAALSGIGATPGAAVGTVVGGVVGPLAVAALGPSDVVHLGVGPLLWLIGYSAAGLVAVAAVTAVVASRLGRAEARAAAWVWDVAVYGAAAVLTAQALLRGGGIDPGEFDLVTLLVPLAAVAAMVAGGLRLTAWLLRGARGHGRGLGAAALLAWRRTTAALASRLGVMLPIGVAAGMALFSAALVGSIDAGLDAKARVIVGADVALSPIDFAVEAPPGSVKVRAATVSLQTGERAWLVVLDPDGYAEAVGWLDSFGMDAESFLASLAPGPEGRIAAAAAGPGAEELGAGGLRFQSLALGYEVVSRLEAVPLMSPSQPTIVVRTDALVEWLERNPLALAELSPDQEIDLDVLLRGMPPQVLTTDEAAATVREAVERSGARVREVVTTADVAADPAFAGQRWALEFLRLVSLAALVLAFIVFVFLVAEERKRLVVADALTRRMGLRPVAAALGPAFEILVLTAVALAMGAAAAAALSWLLLDGFDPLPGVRPLLDLRMPTAEVLRVMAVGLALAIVTWVWSQLVTARTDPAEVLRG